MSQSMFGDYPDILTSKQVQQMLNLSRTSVSDLLKTRSIKSFRKGRKYLIPKICVIDYISKQIA